MTDGNLRVPGIGLVTSDPDRGDRDHLLAELAACRAEIIRLREDRDAWRRTALAWAGLEVDQ